MKSFSFPTKLYLVMTYVAGTIIFIINMVNMNLSNSWMLVILCVLASLALILKVIGSTKNSHYTFSFLVYGFTFAMFGLPNTLIVIIVSNLVEWIWNKPLWYGQLFNIGSYILAMGVASLPYSWINPANSINTWQTVVAIIVSMAVFNILNHFMVGIVVWLARGENFKTSGIFDFFPLMLDLTLLYFGASLSFVWNYNQFALGLFIIPLYLIYATLRVPALERQTEIDSKTGLFNHDYFKKQLDNELARANRFDRPLSVIFSDLDLLRNINNTYGHIAGDEILIGVAKALKDSVREYDIVCRFGGEEFAILLPEASLAQAYERAEILRKTIEILEFTVPTSMTPIRATMSFGVAQRENFSQSSEGLLHNADLALYHSKLSGRNRCFAYTDDAYVDFLTNVADSHPLPKSAFGLPDQNMDPNSQKPHPIEPVEHIAAKTSTAPSETDSAESGTPKRGKKTQVSSRSVVLFISALTSVSLLSFLIMLHWMPFEVINVPFDWFGLLVISILIAMSEWFSIDLYFRQTSVSTSAIPILVAYLIFGAMGVITASFVLAVFLLIKYRSPFNRFLFNFSNHLLSGVVSLALIGFIGGGNFLGLSPVYQILLCLVSAATLYLITTWMISIGMSLDLKQPALQIWKEQFLWLSPYYLGIGFISYAMIFGYKHDHVIGLLLMVIPMILLRISQMQYIDRTRQVVTELREKNQILKKNSDDIAELNEGLLLTLSEIIDLRDPYVLGHSKQVSQFATNIARTLGLNEKQIDLIRKGGLMHDIGKLGIAMEILSKPGKLTLEEYGIIKKHATMGGDLVKNSPSLRPLLPIILHHHEHYDGKGYPDGLAGNQITIEARIIAVADAIEAMLSDRPYRKGLKPYQVIEELGRYSGTQFDPLVVKEAVKMLEASIERDKAFSNQPEKDNGIAPQAAINLQNS